MEQMSMDENIKRINELYRKSQTEGLTEAERKEQTTLRSEYAANIRNNLRSQLNNISIEQEDGTIENLGERFGGREGHDLCCTLMGDKDGK